jgi:conjugative relaxase-like TrwC/TraI family protein
LWAVADPVVAAVIERAHQAAVEDALAFIETHALFTRTGPQGIRQVNVRGLVATAFTHRDSRAGDPDLHTHVAVANKVQTFDGRWLSIDGRVLFKANVAASETYNTALEQHLRDSLGVRFAERPGTDPAKRPIREIVGVDSRLNQRWSTRRAHINTRRSELAIVSSMIMAGHRPRSRRCIWRSRRLWRPATPSTNPGPWLSNAQPGSTRPQPCWADIAP